MGESCPELRMEISLGEHLLIDLKLHQSRYFVGEPISGMIRFKKCDVNLKFVEMSIIKREITIVNKSSTLPNNTQRNKTKNEPKNTHKTEKKDKNTSNTETNTSASGSIDIKTDFAPRTESGLISNSLNNLLESQNLMMNGIRNIPIPNENVDTNTSSFINSDLSSNTSTSNTDTIVTTLINGTNEITEAISPTPLSPTASSQSSSLLSSSIASIQSSSSSSSSSSMALTVTGKTMTAVGTNDMGIDALSPTETGENLADYYYSNKNEKRNASFISKAKIFTKNETISKFQIIDGSPQIGQIIPFRYYFSSEGVVPTRLLTNSNFSVKYILNLILVGENNKRYYKQHEIEILNEDIDDTSEEVDDEDETK